MWCPLEVAKLQLPSAPGSIGQWSWMLETSPATSGEHQVGYPDLLQQKQQQVF